MARRISPAWEGAASGVSVPAVLLDVSLVKVSVRHPAPPFCRLLPRPRISGVADPSRKASEVPRSPPSKYWTWNETFVNTGRPDVGWTARGHTVPSLPSRSPLGVLPDSWGVLNVILKQNEHCVLFWRVGFGPGDARRSMHVCAFGTSGEILRTKLLTGLGRSFLNGRFRKRR